MKLLTSIAILCFASIELVHATPIGYGIEFTVENISAPLDARVQIGNVYFGFFEIDDTALAADGTNQAGLLSACRIEIEDLVWDMTLAAPLSAFYGFRGPGGLGAASPGFDVMAGEIVNLRGGVYGVNDAPFVDFSVVSNNTFSTYSALGAFSGSMIVNRMPDATIISEPTTLACGLIGFLGLMLSRRRAKMHGV